MIITWVFEDIRVILLVLLFLVVVKAISGSYVFNAKDMFWSFGGEVPIWDEHAISMWSSFVAGKIGDQFGISLDATFGSLLGNKVITRIGFIRVEGTYDTGYNVQVHGISSHSKEFTFRFWPFP